MNNTKEKRKEYMKEYFKKKLLEDPDYFRKQYRKRVLKEDVLRKTHVNTLRIRAEKNGIPFEIEADDLDWPSHCPVLGVALVRGEKSRRNSPSIDRIDPSLGYVKGNVRVISRLANSMKQDASKSDLEMFCSNIMKYIDGEI